MTLSTGTIMLIIGCAGAVICLGLFLASWKIFARRRKKLLEKLEKL